MPGCSAYNCKNSAAKGFLMKTFPRDQERRKLWASKVGREDWNPTNYSVLCEVHFEEDMWEKTREDGKRKLKFNAVPSLFNFDLASCHQEVAKNPAVILIFERKNLDNLKFASLQPEIFPEEKPSASFAYSSSMDRNESTIEHQSAEYSLIEEGRKYREILQIKESTNAHQSTEYSLIEEGRKDREILQRKESTNEHQSTEYSLIEEGRKDREILQRKLHAYNCQYIRLLNRNKVYRNKLRNYKIKVKKQEIEIQSLKGATDQHSSTKLLQSILNPDQINALKRKNTKGMEWSNSTIKKALKLKISCGTTGYEEILKQNIPLPSVRTLQRYLENLNQGS